MKHKFLNFQSLFLATLCLIFTMGFTSCSDDDDSEENSIVGTWLLQLPELNEVYNCQIQFLKNGTHNGKCWYTPSESEPTDYDEHGKWSTSGEYLTLTWFEENGEIETMVYRYGVDGNKLIIYDFEEKGPNIFYKR